MTAAAIPSDQEGVVDRRQSSPARPASSALSSRSAAPASSTELTATASATAPSAAASAASRPGSTVSRAATDPRTPGSREPAASRTPAPSLRVSPRARASRRAVQVERIAFRLPLRLDQLGDAFDGVVVRLGRRLVSLVEPDLALVEEPRPARAQSQLALGSTNPVAGAVGGGAQPRDLLAGGGGPGTQRIHSTGQGCDAFAAIACGLRPLPPRRARPRRVPPRAPCESRPRRAVGFRAASSSWWSAASEARSSSASAASWSGSGPVRSSLARLARCRPRSAASDAVPRKRS